MEANDRVRVRRHPERGDYSAETIHQILDEAYYCHVGFASRGQSVVLPTTHARVGDVLYLHGAAASAMLNAASDAPICLTATILDGLVLARSVYHHSMNYRSVVVFGVAREVTDETEKRMALEALVEHVVPGRSKDARPPTGTELASTRVLRLAIGESSAKIRTGPPKDSEADHALDVWAGVVPLHLETSAPTPDPEIRPGIPVPDYLRGLGSARRNG
ncbi:MAG: pyridoxamine 5'-phosphate oxidase family protein [Thermaerobacter sp.]|nr:pyridoxamine 5'-phosphate oxidase family protein [Thermaerobacter sp.]